MTGKVVNTVVLEDLTFFVPEGEILGVIGKNGSGKSTLLRLLANVYRKTSGVIVLTGQSSTLFEMGVFMDVYATGRSYCKDYYEFMGVQKAHTQSMISFVEEFTELGEAFDLPVYQYSAGMMARLLFAVTASMPAKIYLIDEALVVGDQYFQDKAWGRLFYLLSQGASGILVTHDFQSLKRLCPRTIWIDEGRVAFNGETERAIQKYLNVKEPSQHEPVVGFLREEMVLEKSSLCGESGKPFSMSYRLYVRELPEHEDILFALHVEKVRKYGGNLLLNNVEQWLKITQCGVYDCEVSIEHLEVSAGDYLLSLYIGYTPREDYGYFEVIYDEWKSIPFCVKDNSEESMFMEDCPLFRVKLEWRIQCE